MLLFTQLAVSAYACPALAEAARGTAVMAEMPGCDGNMPRAMDTDQPQLCQAHCQQGLQTVQTAPMLDAPVSPVLLAVLDWSPVALVHAPAADRTPLPSWGAAPRGSPPLYLSLLVLRN